MPEASVTRLVDMASGGALDYDEDGDMDNGDASVVAVPSSLVSAGLFITFLDTIVIVNTCSYIKSRKKIARVHSMYIISLLHVNCYHDGDDEDQEDLTSVGWYKLMLAQIVTGP